MVHQGLPSLPGFTTEVKREMAFLAFQLLQERYYSSPQQVNLTSPHRESSLLEHMLLTEESSTARPWALDEHMRF